MIDLGDSRCRVCGDAGPKRTLYKADYRIVECAACRFQFKVVGAQVQSLNDQATGEEFIRTRLDDKRRMQGRLSQLKRILAKGRRSTGLLLEVGPGTGEYLLNARDLGLQTLGVELSANLVRFQQERGLDVRLGRLRDFPDLIGAADFVLYGHVIEHVTDPLEELRSAARCLKPGGLLYLLTPNAGAYGAWLGGGLWPSYHALDHVSFWTARTLTDVMKKSGLVEVAAMTSESPNDLYNQLLGIFAMFLRRPNGGGGGSPPAAQPEADAPAPAARRRPSLKRACMAVARGGCRVFHPLLSRIANRYAKGSQLEAWGYGPEN
ncbi:MAG: class I SAM-dependent methyltransferase [Phycisphaerae bacterium]|nr:class I SAM-dependent methyltransferase [Phycisphaerae bacterium]